VKISTPAAIRAADASVTEAGGLPPQLSFSTDTRSLAPGDAFVALRGARFDGHDYLTEALAAGAAAVVVDDPRRVPAGAPALVVRDTTEAYLAFASVARQSSSARVVAVTGSSGKTTTKAFLAQLLESAAPGQTLATPRNENNEIGVAALLLRVPGDARFVVVEFGARHYGEIAPLARAARPETAVVTNIGEAHLEIFGSRARLAETKWGIFATGARRVANAADADSRERAGQDARPVTWFGVAGDPSAPAGARSVVLAGRQELRLRGFGAAPFLSNGEAVFATDVAVAGEHNLRNVAAAAAAALDLGLEPAAVAAALAGLELPPGRYERSSVAGFDVIYDAYNANLSGMLATLASFAQERGTRRIAVLSSMAELGDDASAMHRRVGAAAAAAGLATLLVGGEFAPDLARGARAGGLPEARIVPFADNAAAIAWLRGNAREGDVVLLKGSRRYRLEEVVAGLRGAHAG
jgi:UDP-N-acetylmuramoyl-tripeptide--D-alanyl-D-alanine ligase